MINAIETFNLNNAFRILKPKKCKEARFKLYSTTISQLYHPAGKLK